MRGRGWEKRNRRRECSVEEICRKVMRGLHCARDSSSPSSSSEKEIWGGGGDCSYRRRKKRGCSGCSGWQAVIILLDFIPLIWLITGADLGVSAAFYVEKKWDFWVERNAFGQLILFPLSNLGYFAACLCFVKGMSLREQETQRARDPESKRAREPESQRAREQDSKGAVVMFVSSPLEP